MRLISPKSGQLGLINHCLLEESQWEKNFCLHKTGFWVLMWTDSKTLIGQAKIVLSVQSSPLYVFNGYTTPIIRGTPVLHYGNRLASKRKLKSRAGYSVSLFNGRTKNKILPLQNSPYMKRHVFKDSLHDVKTNLGHLSVNSRFNR